MKGLLVLALIGYLMYKSSPLYGIAVKPGSTVRTLRPEMMHVLTTARAIFVAHGAPLTVTDMWRDDPTSLHYHNLAVDLRAKNLSYKQRKAILDGLQTSLGTDYQVILHGTGANIHYHIEYDPLRVGTRNFLPDGRRNV